MTRIIAPLLFLLLLAGPAGAAMEITSVSPGRATPDARVVLTGGIFTPQSRVYLGEQFVAPLQLLPRQIEFVVPSLPPGTYSLTVQDDVDAAAQPFLFEVLAPHPQITAIDPPSVDVCADDVERTVRVFGRHFRPGTALLVGGNVVASRVVDEGTLELRLPGLPAGVYGLEARNPDGTTSLPQSLWVTGVPEITGVERGGEFVNHYEVVIRGRNFFFNSILVVREPDTVAGGGSTRQLTYYAHRGAPGAPGGLTIGGGGESLRFNDCRTLVYLRYPSNFQDKPLTLQVINPDGTKTAPYAMTLP